MIQKGEIGSCMCSYITRNFWWAGSFESKRREIVDICRYEPIKGEYKNYIEGTNICLKRILASHKKYPFFWTKRHCPLFIQVLQVNKPEEPQDLELLN